MYKSNLSDKVFTSIIVTIANGKDMDRLCLNKQCPVITTTRPFAYFYYFCDDKIFVTVDEMASTFTKKHLPTLAAQNLPLGHIRPAGWT